MEEINKKNNSYNEKLLNIKETTWLNSKDLYDWFLLLNSNMNELIKNKNSDEINLLFNSQDKILTNTIEWNLKDILLRLSQQLRLVAINWEVTEYELKRIASENHKEIKALQTIMQARLAKVLEFTEQKLVDLKKDIIN